VSGNRTEVQQTRRKPHKKSGAEHDSSEVREQNEAVSVLLETMPSFPIDNMVSFSSKSFEFGGNIKS